MDSTCEPRIVFVRGVKYSCIRGTSWFREIKESDTVFQRLQQEDEILELELAAIRHKL